MIKIKFIINGMKLRFLQFEYIQSKFFEFKSYLKCNYVTKELQHYVDK